VGFSLRIATIALLILAFGCKGDPRPLGWELEFEDSALLSRATVVEAVILEGGCDGTELSSTEVVRGELSMAVSPTLADGRYAFVGRARDSSCTLFAEGCTEVELPTVGPIVVVMSTRPAEVPACSTTFCDGGRCSDAPVDGGVADACAPSETICDDGMDDDCNGDTDCGDDACISDPGCEACASITCGACEVCRGGECFPSDDEAPCAGGTCWAGSCCAGCWDGITCRLGDADAACGARGERCGSCVGCGACADGACAPSMTDDTPCAGGAGLCAAGVCCTGCSDAGGCQVGDVPGACGIGGEVCDDCGECGVCTAGDCAPADGTSCAGGTCRAGACCDGCWDGATCQAGDAPTACGDDGAMCNACLPCQRCESGVCITGMEGDACTSASMQSGTCHGAILVCCAGCWDGSACQPGNMDAQCGRLGNTCQNCAALSCTGGFCR